MPEINSEFGGTVSRDDAGEFGGVVSRTTPQESHKNEYFKSVPDPALGISIPVISPETSKPEVADKGFLSSVTDSIKNWWSRWSDESPEKTSIYSPFYEDLEDPVVVAKQKSDNVRDIDMRIESVQKSRAGIKDELKDSPGFGKGPNIKAVTQNALELYTKGTEVYDSVLGISIPTTSVPTTLQPSPDLKTKVEGETDQELKNLGFDYVTDDKGNTTLQQVNKPVYSQQDITKKLTTIKQAYELQLGGLEKELKDLKDRKEELGESKPSITEAKKPLSPIDNLIQRKSQEIANLNKNYSEIVGIYGSIANAPTYVGSDDIINDPYKQISQAPKDAPVDYKPIVESLKKSIEYIKQYQSNPNLEKDMTDKGISYTYVDDEHAQFEERQHLKNPRSGRNLPQAMVDYWHLNGLVPNIKSLNPLLDADTKIIAQLDEAIKKTQQEAIKKRIPVEQIDAIINQSGLFDLLNTWQDFKEAKQSLQQTLTKPLNTGLKDLVAYKATEKYYDALYKKEPVLSGFRTALANVAQNIANLETFGEGLFPDKRDVREDLFKAQYVIPSYDKVIVPEKTVEIEAFDGGIKKIKKTIPAVTERTPFYEKGTNIFDPNPVNWDVLAYQATKMPLDLYPLIAAGEIAAPAVLAGLGPTLAKVGGLAAIEGILGETLGGAGYGWRAANIAAKVGEKVIPRAVGVVIPSMVVFGPETVKREMQNKNLTEEQATKLGLYRSLAEGIAFSISPLEMGKIGYKMLTGEVVNAAEEAAYKTLIEKGLGQKLTDKTFNFLFNTKALGKAVALSYGETAVNLIGQLETALVQNAALTKYAQAKFNPNYIDPEHELTVDNMVSTATEALGTAIPFSLLHIGPKFQETRFAREAALYKIAQSPGWYLDRINKEYTSLEQGIDVNEALQRKTLIEQVRDIYGSLKPDFDSIDSSDLITPEAKHAKKFELFRNRLKQEGLKEELLKDISDEEKTKHLEELDKTATEYQKLLDFQKQFDQLSPDEKDRVLANQEFSKYVQDNLNSELLKRYSIEDYEARVKELRNLALEAKNPFLSVRYQEAANALDLVVADAKFKERQDPKIMQEKVSEFTDWLENKITEANESFDKILRTSSKDTFTEEDRYNYVKDFVEGGMTAEQKFLYDKHKDLIEAEQQRRVAVEEPVEPEVSEPARELIDKVEPKQEVDTNKIKEDIEKETPDVDKHIEAIAKRESGQPLTDPEWLQSLSPEVDPDMVDKFSNLTLGEVSSYFTENKLNDADKIIGNSLPAEIAARIGKSIYDKTGNSVDVSALTPNQIKSDYGINLYTGEVFAPVIPEAPVVPEQVLKNKAIEQTLEYRALNEREADVKKDNRTSEARVFKLADINLSQEGPVIYDGKRLLSPTGVIAYAAVEATYNPETGKWTKASNDLDPAYAFLHSSKFYQAGTEITFEIVDEPNSLFTQENKKKYFENRELVDQYGYISSDEYDANGNDPDNFAIIKISDQDGNLLGYVHDLSYARSARIVDYVYRPNQEPIFNLGPAYTNLITYRKQLLKALRENGGKLKGIIDGSTLGSRSIRSDEKFVPLTQAFTNPSVLKEITVVTSPERYRIQNQMLANWEEIVPGSAIAPVKTPNGKWYGIVLQRNMLGKERARGVENALNFYVDYVDASKRDDVSLLAKLDKVAEEVISKMVGDYKYDIRTSDGLRAYLSNLVYIGEQTSKYTMPGPNRKDLSAVPFIDFDSRENTLTFSSRRILEGVDENKRMSSFEDLNNIGVFKQLFFDKEGKKNPNAARFFKQFARWVESRPLNFKTENFEITTSFEIPLLEKTGDDYSFMDVKEAVTSGKSFQDYLVNNLKTDNLEHKITNKDNSQEFVYFEQPTKSFKPVYPEPEPVEERLPVEEFLDQFKQAKTYAEAAALAKEGIVKYPGIARSIEERVKELRPTMTYEEKAAEFEKTWEKHNDLVRMLKNYNDLSKKEKNKAANLHSKINLLAEELNYNVVKGKYGRFIITREGKKITTREYPEKPLEVIDGKITYAGQQVGVSDAEPFRGEIDIDRKTLHADFGLSNAQLKSGFKQLDKNNLSSLPAQRILKKIATWKNQGYVDLVQGSGFITSRDSEDYTKYTAPTISIESYPDYLQEVGKLPDIDSIDQETLINLAKEYDEWFDSLTPEEQEKHLEEYEEYTYTERESELYEAEEAIGEVPEISEEIEESGKIDEKKEIKDLKPVSEYIYLLDDGITPTSSVSNKIDMSKDYQDLEKLYKNLTFEERIKLGPLEDIISARSNWPEKFIIDWINCDK